MKYYAGIYQDDKGKIMQISNDIDGLNCEILAEPGVVITQDFQTVTKMINAAKTTAKFLKCHHLEINCDKKYGSYRFIRI